MGLKPRALRSRRASPMRHTISLAAAPLCCCCAGPMGAPVAPTKPGGEPPTSSLYRESAGEDGTLSAAVNGHDVTALMGMFAEDLEFYQRSEGRQTYNDVRNDFGGM